MWQCVTQLSQKFNLELQARGLNAVLPHDLELVLSLPQFLQQLGEGRGRKKKKKKGRYFWTVDEVPRPRGKSRPSKCPEGAGGDPLT